MPLSLSEDSCVHLGIKGEAGAQDSQCNEVYLELASNHLKGGFHHTHQHLRHDDAVNIESSVIARSMALQNEQKI